MRHWMPRLVEMDGRVRVLVHEIGMAVLRVCQLPYLVDPTTPTYYALVIKSAMWWRQTISVRPMQEF